MDTKNRTPEEHSGDWRFAALEPATARRLTVRPDGMDTVLLVADGEGAWWAVPATCHACGDSLEPAADQVQLVAEQVECNACGAANGPGIPGCHQVATLVVDEEIYLLAGD